MTRIRSAANVLGWVPDPAFLALTAPSTQNFFKVEGGLRLTASMVGNVTCAGLGKSCPAGIPANTVMFDHVNYTSPTDAGGGFPQNTYDTFQRVDWNITDKTQFYARYALFNEIDQSGGLSNSPYANYDLGQLYRNHNALVSLIHTFSPYWIAQSKIVWCRPCTSTQRAR